MESKRVLTLADGTRDASSGLLRHRKRPVTRKNGDIQRGNIGNGRNRNRTTRSFATSSRGGVKRHRRVFCVQASAEDSQGSTVPVNREGPSADLSVIYNRFIKLALPYWSKESNDNAREAQIMLAGVFVLTLGCTGVSVLFNFLGRDFYNALAEKDVDGFWHQMQVYLVAIPVCIPVYIFRDFYSSKLQLKWRKWMTKELTKEYFSDQKYYNLQGNDIVDNPDQRLSADVNIFTDTALGFSLTLLNCIIDLVSFSNILYSIYPPLFLVLLVYALGGTFISIQIGKPLVGIKFQQEKREADFRYSLVRIRDNAESIAFFKGENKEMAMLEERLGLALENLLKGILKSRDLSFFQSFYKYVIQLLPAAVIAPLFFRGEIEFGVINQSASAFNHILSDVSLVVYQFEALAGFSAVIDRLGQFTEALEEQDRISNYTLNGEPGSSDTSASKNGAGAMIVQSEEEAPQGSSLILKVEDLSLKTPDGETLLTKDLNMEVQTGDSLLVVGRSGVGKTSLLRAIAGLWKKGNGQIKSFHNGDDQAEVNNFDTFFLPQRPYMVLGTLRDQLLYPYTYDPDKDENGDGHVKHVADDELLRKVLVDVKLGDLLQRCNNENKKCGLDYYMDWSTTLSLGEQQRLAFGRLLVSKPRIAILDESTSALDVQTEAHLYNLIQEYDISYVSVGHRPTLLKHHKTVLRLKRDGEQFEVDHFEATDMNVESYVMNS